MTSATSTELWNSLYFLYLAIAILVGGGVLGWLGWSLVKFRWRPGDPRPHDAPLPGVLPAERGHILWVYVMAGGIAAIMFGLAFSTISAVETLDHPPEGENVLHMNVTGFAFGWKFNYTGTDGVRFQEISPPYTDFTGNHAVPTPDASPGLVVPVHTNVAFNVTSQDVWHNFAIPNFRIRVDAIPGQVNHLWFNATDVGNDHTVCVMLCGAGHATMRADMYVMTQPDYDAWLKARSEKEFDDVARGGGQRNVTLAGGALLFDNATAKSVRGGVTLLVTNHDGAAHVVRTATGASASVPAGATIRMWTPAPKGSFLVSSEDATAALEVR